MIDTTRGYISLFLGFIAAAFGLIPLLSAFGVIGFNLPSSLFGMILEIILVLGGIFLLVDSLHEDNLRWMSVIIGIVILAFGAVPLLANFGIISNFLASILAIEILVNIILVVAGFLLILGSGD